MSWKCPECNEPIEDLRYEVDTTSYEYGTAELNSRPRPEQPQTRQINGLTLRVDYEVVVDHNYDDTGDSNWDGDVKYECPECSATVNPNNLIWINDDDEEEDEFEEGYEEESEETKRKKKEIEIKKQILEETEHEIIRPKKHIILNQCDRISTDQSFICQNKECRHVFVAEIKNEHSYGEFFVECPKCSTVNSSETYKKLLSEGYFNQTENDKPRKKSIKYRPGLIMARRPGKSKILHKIQRPIRT
ncbi:MAG: hypothetical protein WC069_05785 [Candidatus Shapirobacteria bacterium]